MPVQWTILNPYNTTILPVDGTAKEFSTGVDAVEWECVDDSARVKRLFEICDYLILGSPTYQHNVSGDMKNIMDRLAYWGHLFHLAGKPGFAFVSATTNGFTNVGDMLEKFLEGLGVVTGKTVYDTTSSPFEYELAMKKASEIAEALHSSTIFTPNKDQEIAFQIYKSSFIHRDDSDYEYRYWKEHGMFDCGSLSEYFINVSNNPLLRVMSFPSSLGINMLSRKFIAKKQEGSNSDKGEL